MSKNAAGLFTDYLNHRWNAVASPSMGATCTASVQPNSSHVKLHLEQIGWSIYNKSGVSYTATLNVRDASIGGGVLATWNMVIGNGASLQDTFYLQVMGVKGNPLNFEFGTPQASVTQTISASGWYNQSND